MKWPDSVCDIPFKTIFINMKEISFHEGKEDSILSSVVGARVV